MNAPAVARFVLPVREKAGSLFMMGSISVALAALLGAPILLALFAVGKYNSLVILRNRYKNAFSQIDIQLRLRYDLISRLVEIAKDCLDKEGEVLEAVASARNSAYTAGAKAAANPGDMQAMRQLTSAEAGLSAALGRFLAAAEASPDLKVKPGVLALTGELISAENDLSVSGRAYNGAVRAYNKQRQIFPTNLVAGFLHFGSAALCELEGLAEKRLPMTSLA